MNSLKRSLKYIVDGVTKSISYDAIQSDFELIESNEGSRRIVKIQVKKDLELLSATEQFEYKISRKDRILVNGYQSWTDTREFYAHEQMPKIRMPKPIAEEWKFKSYGDYTFKKTEKNVLHGYSYGYLRCANKELSDLFIGSFNEHNAYLIISFKTKENTICLESEVSGKQLKSGDTFTLFDYEVIEGDIFDSQKQYFNNFNNNVPNKIRGYTSWYNHYQNINEEKVLRALEGIDSSNYDLFQIDDGYETFVGDWLDIDSNKFPNGLQEIVNKIHNKNLLAGIWLAPFAVELNSKFYKEHNDLIYKENGLDVFGGGNWSKFVCLDISKQEALDYVEKCLKFYIDLGFDLFKLDFLYSAGLVRGTGLTRAETHEKMFNFLREILKGKLILGCGAPLANAWGKFDYCRIGTDVSLKFDDVFYMRLAHRERISTKMTLQNTIYRSFMDGRAFRNDPDVYLLRKDNIDLNEKQKEALIILNTLCGSVYMTSDDVNDYDEPSKLLLEKVKHLREAEVINYDRRNKLIDVTYSYKNELHILTYDTKKGEIICGQDFNYLQ